MDAFTALLLPYRFNGARLDADLETALAHEWKSHYNAADYTGHWKIIALRSENGREDSITANDRPTYTDTALMARCPYFREVLDTFACEKQAVRLMQLAPGSGIKPHRDSSLGYEDGVFRLHIPIRTHEEVYFHVDENRLPMRRGECWYANFNLTHRVENRGTEPRIHLVVDCLRNAWTDELFAANGYDLSQIGKPRLRPQDVPHIIARLEAMGTDKGRELAESMRREWGIVLGS